MNDIVTGPDGQSRCRWCAGGPEMLDYHDTEWGFPVRDDVRLFEKLSLEGFQSGLSWRAILLKRGHFREAFDQFDFNRIAHYTERDVERLVRNEGIIRHRGKIEAVLNNARLARDIVEREGSLAAFIWRFEPEQEPVAPPRSATTSAESVALSKALKKQGWKFVGPTTMYAFMQSMGLINDHAEQCVIRGQVEQARASFRRPGR
ncbi:DNA-3-methyladenine glycosylase I [Paenibacillus methanolicus]|uniref:DNA-3-methyladenine glycosylase I n=1 Tax=Paenibacillus methanolicus TaxID=582686 RepID=A0A5S5CKC4_9BACL|nr:DNA-3-methyladenine glycosylase I [Paenibacillus methanolicus]TYP79011.1 DNA-3-methyladenine glycosylase I [Paenibacillus methanolicus]